MTQKAEIELWCDIKGYEAIYQISNLGRIKSLKRSFVKRMRNGEPKTVFMPETIRSTRYTKAGYNKISLWNNGKAKHLLIHRLVGEYFVFNPDPINFKQIGHIDNNPSNPRWDNLKWGTQKMNIQYAVECGRWHTGNKNHKTKLKESDIPVIRKLISENVTSRNIGKQFNVGHAAILSIKNNNTWKHIKQ